MHRGSEALCVVRWLLVLTVSVCRVVSGVLTGGEGVETKIERNLLVVPLWEIARVAFYN